jgi:hypothetical protein
MSMGGMGGRTVGHEEGESKRGETKSGDGSISNGTNGTNGINGEDENAALVAMRGSMFPLLSSGGGREIDWGGMVTHRWIRSHPPSRVNAVSSMVVHVRINTNRRVIGCMVNTLSSREIGCLGVIN